MDIEKFKKESKVTYVYVTGVPMGLYYNKEKEKCLKFEGFIQVPFSFEEFAVFDEDQQTAICEANLNKAGIPTHITICDPLRFYKEQKQESKKDIEKELEDIKSFTHNNSRNINIDLKIESVISVIDSSFIEYGLQLSKCFVGSHGYDEFAIRQLRKIKDVYIKDQSLFDKYKEESVKLAREFNWDLDKDDGINDDNY